MLQSAGLSTTTVTTTESDDDVTTPTIVTLAGRGQRAASGTARTQTQNFGQATTLEVKNSATSGYRRQSFIRFNLTGVGSADDITSAKVRLVRPVLSASAASLPVGHLLGRGHDLVRERNHRQHRPGGRPYPAGDPDGERHDRRPGSEYDVTNYLKQQKAGGADGGRHSPLKATDHLRGLRRLRTATRRRRTSRSSW